MLSHPSQMARPPPKNLTITIFLFVFAHPFPDAKKEGFSL
jgi:hypothetical protein